MTPDPISEWALAQLRPSTPAAEQWAEHARMAYRWMRWAVPADPRAGLYRLAAQAERGGPGIRSGSLALRAPALSGAIPGLLTAGWAEWCREAGADWLRITELGRCAWDEAMHEWAVHGGGE